MISQSKTQTDMNFKDYSKFPLKSISKPLFIIGLILTFHFMSCDSNSNPDSDQQQMEFNTVIDMFLRLKFEDVKIVKSETLPIFSKNPSYSITISDTLEVIPPPPGMILYSKDFFNSLVNDNKLSSSDAVFMANQIDSTIILDLEINNGYNLLISKNNFSTIIDSDSIELADNYDTNRYLEISSPLFNKDMTKLIFSVDYYCGTLCGHGYIFVLNKVNDKWRIIETIYRWQS